MDEALKMLHSKHKKSVPTLYYREILKLRAISENSLTTCGYMCIVCAHVCAETKPICNTHIKGEKI